jgi:hypothetical protein
MAQTTLKQVPSKVASLTPFKGNSLRAEIIGNEYRIISNSTLMATVDISTRAVWENPQRYSVTTSKHMGKVRAGLASL